MVTCALPVLMLGKSCIVLGAAAMGRSIQNTTLPLVLFFWITFSQSGIISVYF
jgi:hypothetical protein